MDEGTSFIPIIVFFVVIFGMMYFFMIRPQRRKQKEREEMQKVLRKGDNVVTTSGIYGQIESVSEDTIVLKIESGATMRVTRDSVLGKQGTRPRAG